MNNGRVVDVLIVGAGAAGLAAALEISHAGLTAIVIEARDRIGGRVFTLHRSDSALPIELGAEFVHGEPRETFAVIRAAGLNVCELPDDHFRSRNGKLSVIGDFWGQLDEVRSDIMRKMRSTRADISFSDYLDRRKLPSDLRQTLLNFAEGYHAADPEKISARSIAGGDDEEDPGNKQFRVMNGYDSVMEWLRAGLHPERVQLRLNTIATELRWKRRDVTLLCQNQLGADLKSFHGRAAVITIPHAVMKAKALRIKPVLDEKQAAVERLEVGHVFKIVLRFRENFWADNRFIHARLEKHGSRPAALKFIHTQRADIPVWWTALPSRAPVLTGWAGGPKAVSILNEPMNTQVEKSLAALAQMFAVPRSLVDDLLEVWSTHDWRSDPFSRGAYMYVSTGGVAAQKSLAKPVDETLFFGGEATEGAEMGTVGGAIASGRRAAKEVIHTLRK